MKQHYLIQIPPRKSGIYLILNLLKKKAYVGLAQDFCNRALDHFKALSITKDGETTISVNQSGEIVEVEVPGYTSKVSGNPETGFTITNTLEDQDNETSTDGSDDSSDDGSPDDSSDKDSQITTKITTKTTTKTTTTKNPDKKQPDKKKDNNKTGNPVLLGVLAISVAGLAYQLRRKE